MKYLWNIIKLNTSLAFIRFFFYWPVLLQYSKNGLNGSLFCVGLRHLAHQYLHPKMYTRRLLTYKKRYFSALNLNLKNKPIPLIQYIDSVTGDLHCAILQCCCCITNIYIYVQVASIDKIPKPKPKIEKPVNESESSKEDTKSSNSATDESSSQGDQSAKDSEIPTSENAQSEPESEPESNKHDEL